MERVQDKFLRYIAVNTQSKPDVDAVPSTSCQFELAKLLQRELTALGIDGALVDDHANVYASLPASKGCEKLPALGLVAHMDTSPDAPSSGAVARIERDYHGGDIILDKAADIRLSPVLYEHLGDYIGQDLIVTDGHGLLGADDKAGVAEIMALLEALLADPAPHCALYICFTPDEEVGRGTDTLDLGRFCPAFAYTVDGGKLGEIEYECFCAASAVITIHGLNIHPGEAKGKMRNAILMAMELQAMLPAFDNPAFTSGYEGFYHLDSLEGTVECARMHYLVREHDKAKFAARKELLGSIAAFFDAKYGPGTVEMDIKDSYLNMREKVEPHRHLIDNAIAAMEHCGVEPLVVPIRGGTDGARLSYMGIPCPNLSTGGHNYHSRFEYIPVPSLEKMVDCLREIVRLYSVPTI